VYTWAETVGLIDGSANVFDGTFATENCSNINHVQWTANSGTFLYGSALMYNMARLSSSAPTTNIS
jgi:mannan endo-1,6-alpha-mannosidase